MNELRCICIVLYLHLLKENHEILIKSKNSDETLSDGLKLIDPQFARFSPNLFMRSSVVAK